MRGTALPRVRARNKFTFVRTNNLNLFAAIEQMMDGPVWFPTRR